MPEVGNGYIDIPDLRASIVPGFSSAGIEIGSRIEDLFSQSQPGGTERRSEYLVHDFVSVKVWSLNGLVIQIGVYQGYRGTLDHKIGIGSSIAEVEDWCRCQVVENDEDNLIAMGWPGLSFETNQWVGNHTAERNRNASITGIFVHCF
jgi:hypothetical protein